MYIEDLIFTTDMRVSMNPYDSKIISSFSDQLSRGSGLTEKQRELALKILKRQSNKLSLLLGSNIDPFLTNPQFKFGVRVINSVKRLTITKGSDFYKVIKAEFPFSDEITKGFRENKHKFKVCNWNPDEKAWIFSLEESTIEFLSDVAAKYEFTVDEEFRKYCEQIKFVKENIEDSIPMVKLTDGIPKIVNVPNSLPQPNTNDNLESLFYARKVGVKVWDDEFNQIFEDNQSLKLIKNFLNSDPASKFDIYLDDTTIFEIINIVKYLSPCLFIIPGGNETEKIQLCLDALKTIGINEEATSVLFRLPKETGENFNNFVKNQKLNNPITDKIKAVFISSKVPKTIIEPEIHFNSVVNFNFYNVHYTIREFVKNHHNVLQIFDTKPQRIMNFGNM